MSTDVVSRDTPPKVIGYWRASIDDPYPFPQELVGQMTQSQRVAEYLDRGKEIHTYLGVSFCRFGCSEPCGYRDLTDGVWVWPEGLSHYVREHGVRLPEAFVAHALDPATRPRPFRRWEVEEYDDAPWLEWADEHRSHLLDEHVAAAVRGVEPAVQRSIEAAGAELRDDRGEGAEECIGPGCERRALVGETRCGLCTIEARGFVQLFRPRARLDAVFQVLQAAGYRVS